MQKTETVITVETPPLTGADRALEQFHQVDAEFTALRARLLVRAVRNES